MSKRTLLWLPVLLLMAAPLAAQTPTRAGTTITNTATVTYTDANNNTYTPQSASASVTVGFQAGIDVSAPTSPMVPSATTGMVAYTVSNTGNDVDQFAIAISGSGGLTVDSVLWNGATYTSLPAFHAAILAQNVDMGETESFNVWFTVNAGESGNDQTLTVTATSNRDSGVADVTATTIMVPAAGVTVAASPTAVSVLPTTGGITYTVDFTVTNTGAAATTFDLSLNAAAPLAIASSGGMPSSVTLPAAGAEGDAVTYTITYTVADGASGTVGTITLSATNAADASVTDNAVHTATIERPAVGITKVVTDLDDVVITGEVFPGDEVRYTITVTNNGSANASTVTITDALPAELIYVSHTATGADSHSYDPDTHTVSGTVATLNPAATMQIVITARIR